VHPPSLRLSVPNLGTPGYGNQEQPVGQAMRSRLPGLKHYTIFSDPALAAAVIPFLDQPAPTGR